MSVASTITGICAALLFSTAAHPLEGQEPPDFAGDWIGRLEAGGVEIRLIFHIRRGSDGAYSATVDSPDQGATGLPASSVTVEGEAITVELRTPPGSYAGKLRDGAIEGSWRQGAAAVPLTLEPYTEDPDAGGDEGVGGGLTGTWRGALSGGALPIVFRLERRDDGTYFGTMDSPAQGATGIPLTDVVVDGDSIEISIVGIGASYRGALDDEAASAETISGVFEQAGMSLPMELSRGPGEAEPSPPARPQTPRPPFPYETVEIAFTNPAGGHVLAGTLTVPEGAGRPPAAVLISGSGPQDRDEAIAGHKPFHVLADHLSRRGIAVLRFDDRGVGASQGVFATATSADLASDVVAAVLHLRGREDVDPEGIGLIGHSEGGLIAPLVAAADPGIAFSVLLAGPGVPGEKILYAQSARILQAEGASEERMRANRALQAAMLEAALRGADADEIAARAVGTLRSLPEEEREALGFPADAMETVLERQAARLASPWFRSFLSHDPASVLAEVRSPVLALVGELDLQVPPDQNIPPIRAALAAAGNPHSEVHELEGLNHLFQSATTGSPREYAQIEETMSPVALETISSWILEVTTG